MTTARTWTAGFAADARAVFVDKWSPLTGMLLLVLIVVALMTQGLFWGIFGGVRHWGDLLNNALGLGPLIGVPHELEPLASHRMSLMNIALVLGAFAAALLARQFRPQRPPAQEYAWAVVGGALMGVGAALAGGCTTGGFFNPVLHASPAGWTMALGLMAGAALGFKALLWGMEHLEWGQRAPADPPLPASFVRAMPWLGAVLVLVVIGWGSWRWQTGDTLAAQRAFLVLAGFAIGFVMHRARLCFAKAFREPFVTADGTMTKAMIVGLAVGVPLAALLFSKKVIDPYVAIPPTFWLGSLAGGVVFGIGMVFAGGCASGSLWRMGEGHAKLWVAMLAFAWVGSTASALFKRAGLTSIDETNVDLFERTAVGHQAYWPELLGGWAPTLAATAALLVVWWALVRWNESTERFTLM